MRGPRVLVVSGGARTAYVGRMLRGRLAAVPAMLQSLKTAVTLLPRHLGKQSTWHDISCQVVALCNTCTIIMGATRESVTRVL